MTEKLRILLRDNRRCFWTDEQLEAFLVDNEGENRLWICVRDAVTELFARDPMPEMSQELVEKYRLLGINAAAQNQHYGEQTRPAC